MRRILLKQPDHISLIGQITFDKRIILIFFQNGQPVFFKLNIIIVIQIIKSDHSCPPRQKASGQMIPDKTCAACYKKSLIHI